MTRYTSNELNRRAKNEFRKIQKTAVEGLEYVYRGWGILLNGSHAVLLLVNYDVRPIEGRPRKLTHTVQL